MKPLWLPLVLAGLLGSLWEYGPPIAIAALVVVVAHWRSLRLGAGALAYAFAVLLGGPGFEVVVAVAAALVLVAHDLHARRPGVWFPLFAVGVGLIVTTFQHTGFGPLPWWYETEVTLDDYQITQHLGSVGIGVARVDEPDLALTATPGVAGLVVSVVVALGLGLWAHQARSLTVALTAACYLAAAWYLTTTAAGPPEDAQFLAPDGFHVLDRDDDRRPEVVLLAGAAVAFV
ncbi:hypothetical protein, partial [Actinosynnema sp. NPDC020468]|uniref:hypothetical protein n=1 Tax=Actinosynnema sp. NPDC020468 TaxID=3154488 RepID=UPI0033D7B265